MAKICRWMRSRAARVAARGVERAVAEAGQLAIGESGHAEAGRRADVAAVTELGPADAIPGPGISEGRTEGLYAAKHDRVLTGNVTGPPCLDTDLIIGSLAYHALSFIHSYFFQVPVHCPG